MSNNFFKELNLPRPKYNLCISSLSHGEMTGKMVEHIEKKLLQLKTTGKGQDVVRYQKMIGEKLAYLAENVQISDFRPADSYYEVYELLHKRLQDVGLEYDNLVSNDLEEFISKMNSQDINTVVFN